MCGRYMIEGKCAIEEAGLTKIIRVVGRRNEGGISDHQLRRRHTGLEAKLLIRRQRNCLDDSRRRQCTDALWTIVQVQAGPGGICPARQGCCRGQAKKNSPLATGVASFVITIDAASDIQKREATAVDNPIVVCAARDLRSGPKHTEASAFTKYTAMNWATAFIRDQIHHTA